MEQENNQKNMLFAVVSESEAKSVPYPYVFVDRDGTVRELHISERKYLETRFHPADGGRPYVKSSMQEKNGWGDISGFCLRSAIPPDIKINESPLDDPIELARKNFLEEQNKLAIANGFEVIKNADGTITHRRLKTVENKTEKSGFGKIISNFFKRK